MNERIEAEPKTFKYDATSDLWYNGREYFSGYLKIGDNEYKRVAIHAVANNSSYSYRSGKLLGFQLRERFSLKITDKGIGNGISLLIMVGILARLPQALIQEFTSKVTNNNGGPILSI